MDILKELNEIAKELNAEDPDEDAHELIKTLDAKTDEYQELYLNEQLAQLKYDMANDEAEKAIAELDRRTQGVRDYLRECIETNAPNAEVMRELAHELIDGEKKHGVYDPANWAWLGAGPTHR